MNHLIALNKLFETDEQRNISGKLKPNNKILENTNVNCLTKENILDLLRSEWYQSLKGQTQQLNIRRIRTYLKYSKRNDLVELLPKKFKIETKQLSKTDLISRKELDTILKFSNLRGRTLIMVMYEGALRRDELLNIRKKHIKFESGYIILKVAKSKTIKRDIPLVESIPYLKEYFYTNFFEPDDLIFPYNEAHYLNIYLNNLKNRIAKKYPEWKSKKLNPHLFKHSRLTELALSKLNEPQLRKIAGWTANSKMPSIYFHLDDSDIISIMTEDVVQKPKPKRVKIINCPICNVENSEQNIFCWKCSNVIDNEKRMEAELHLIIQSDEIAEINKKLTNMDNVIQMLTKILFHKYTENNYPDLELGDGAKLTNLIIKEFNILIDKE